MARTSIHYRSWVALTLWSIPGLGLVAFGIGAAWKGPDRSPLIIAIPGLLLLAYTWWPCVIVRPDVLVIRNLGSRQIPWNDVVRVQVESQLPYLGRFWRLVNSGASGRARIGREGFPGLVVHTTGSTIAAAGIRASVLSGEGSGFAERVASEIAVARRAARRGDDPATAIRVARRTG